MGDLAGENLDFIVDKANVILNRGNEVDAGSEASYRVVFCLESVNQLSVIQKSTDGYFYVRGAKFRYFSDALDRLDEFKMNPYSIVPTFLDCEHKHVVLERLNELLAGVEPNYYSDKWRDSWQKAFGCKCYLKNQRPFFKLEYEHIKISFVAHALTPGHYKLERKLTELLEFLFQGYHPYFLLEIEMEDDVQMMKQNKVYSGLLLKYFRFLYAWTKQNLKVRQFIWDTGNINPFWLEMIEDDIQMSYEIKHQLYSPDFVYGFDKYSVTGAEKFMRNADELFGRTICAYEDYMYFKKMNKPEEEALFYSGLHNQKHKELAELLLANYSKRL